MAEELISLDEAVAKGIIRLRQPIWAEPLDHIQIDILTPEQRLGPWISLYCPMNKYCNGLDPLKLFSAAPYFDRSEKQFVPYTGPLPDSDEYRESAKRYDWLPPAVNCLERNADEQILQEGGGVGVEWKETPMPDCYAEADRLLKAARFEYVGSEDDIYMWQQSAHKLLSEGYVIRGIFQTDIAFTLAADDEGSKDHVGQLHFLHAGGKMDISLCHADPAHIVKVVLEYKAKQEE